MMAGKASTFQHLYCEICDSHANSPSWLRPVKRYITMYCMTCHADRRFKVRKSKPAPAKKPDAKTMPVIKRLDDHIDDLLELRKAMPAFAASSISCDKSLERIDGLVRTLCNVACCEVPPEIPEPPKTHHDCSRHNAEGSFDCDCDRLFAIDVATEAGNPNAKYHEVDECNPKFSCPRHDREASG